MKNNSIPPGEKAFRSMAERFAEQWKSCPFQKKLLAAVDGDLWLAMAIYGMHGQQAFQSLDRELRYIQKTPRELLKTEEGIETFKTCIYDDVVRST